MLLYYLLWMLMGLFLHFYIIFGTNLLNEGLAQIAIFFAYFRVSSKRNIKRRPNGMKPSGMWFPQQTWSRRLGVGVKKQQRKPRGRGRALHPRGPLIAPPTYFLRLYILPYLENIKKHHENLIPLPQPSVSARSHLGAFVGAPPEGKSTMEGLYIISKASPMSCE